VADARVVDVTAVRKRLQRVRERHGEVLVIVSPPRTASTALARILWNHPDVGFYSHEPFEPTYYRDAPLDAAADLLDAATPIAELNPARAASQVPQDDPSTQPAPPSGEAASSAAGTALVVKEMTFQVGDAFPLLAELATRPIVFLVRDPRLSIASRMRVLERAGRPAVFPLRESGWDDLERQLDHVRREGVDHLIVDSTQLRAVPTRIAPGILERLGLTYAPELLTWKSSTATGLSAVSGAADPFYQHVLASGGLEAPVEVLPSLSDFPDQNGFRAHVAECMTRYEALRPEFITRGGP
jgi:hypothetical protein